MSNRNKKVFLTVPVEKYTFFSVILNLVFFVEIYYINIIFNGNKYKEFFFYMKMQKCDLCWSYVGISTLYIYFLDCNIKQYKAICIRHEN